MKVLVCGSRSWRRADVIRERLAQLPRGTVIVHGGARGADMLASEAARSLGLTEEVYRPEWERFGRSAAFKRNVAMFDANPDLVLAFWDGQSSGTLHTLGVAVRRYIPVEVVEG